MWTLSMLLLLLLCEIGVSNTFSFRNIVAIFFSLSPYWMNSVVWCGACAMCIFSTAKRGRWMDWNETGMVVMHFFFGKCSNYINVFRGNSGVNSAHIFVYFSFSCWLCLTVICSVLRTFKSLCVFTMWGEVWCITVQYKRCGMNGAGEGDEKEYLKRQEYVSDSLSKCKKYCFRCQAYTGEILFCVWLSGTTNWFYYYTSMNTQQYLLSVYSVNSLFEQLVHSIDFIIIIIFKMFAGVAISLRRSRRKFNFRFMYPPTLHTHTESIKHQADMNSPTEWY